MRSDDPSGLAGIPLEALDEEWAQTLRDGTPATRRLWIAAADGLQAGATEQKSRARAVYWALREDLDPTGASDVARILHVLRSGLERGPEFALLATRAAGANDERLRWAAQICVAQCQSMAGEYADAEARLREILGQLRGSGTRLERTAYSSLAVVYQNQGREFEALVLTRIVLRLSTDAADPWEACVAHQQYCSLLFALGDWVHMDAALADLERVLRVANPPWAWKMWRYIHGERAETALQRGDIEAMRASMCAMLEAVPAGTDPAVLSQWYPLLTARLALAEGRPADAITHLQQDGLATMEQADIAAVQAYFLVEDADAAVARGRACLDRLASEREVWGGAAQRLRSSAKMASLFEDHGAEPDDVRRAYDIAAEAAMRRIFELEHSLATLPDLGVVEPADMQALAAFRVRFRDGHARLLARLTSYLVAELESGSPLEVNEGHLRVCAWCHRIASRASRWLPVGHLLPSQAGVPVTHTICPDCVQSHGFA